MPFQASECYSPTWSQARVLVIQAFVMAYLQVSYDLLNARKWRNHYWQAVYKDNFSRVLNQESPFFGSRVEGFASNLSCLKYWLLRLFFYEEAICEGSTEKGLPYAAKAVPAKDYFTHLTQIIARKGRWVISPNYRAYHPLALLCCWGCSCSKIWRPSWLTLRCMPYGRGTLRISLQSICSKEGPYYRLEQSARKLS